MVQLYKMEKKIFCMEEDGFYGAWYPNPNGSSCGLILMLGESTENHMIISGVKWLHKQGCHVMAVTTGKEDHGYHNFPLERFEKAIIYMKEQGCRKLGIVGASATGMLALAAASYYPELTLTIAVTPSDFVMEGFYKDGKDGARERPGDGESIASWQGEPLPYLPYAYRHPEFWQKIKEESKAGKDMIASRKLFDESERRHPLREEEKIKVERIKGRIICIGAEDDVLWDTCKYIRRMEQRLSALPHNVSFEAWLYEHGTHFAFPETMLKMMLPIGSGLLVRFMFKAGKQYPKECRQTRIDIDGRLRKVFAEWTESEGDE